MSNEPDNNNTTRWHNPLGDYSWAMPLGKYHPAGFGAQRKYSLHTGIDLFCEHMQPVTSVESGTVVGIDNFSKNNKHSTPWLNRTRVILIEGKTGVCVYGNVREAHNLKVGQKVQAGDVIGNVIRINRKRKKKDVCMLHFELYAPGTSRRVSWSYNFPKPGQLLDPSAYLIKIITDNATLYRRRS